ncbi:HCO3 transporter family protein [Usnea florida]
MSSPHPTLPPYSFDHATGWRRYRMLRPGWGMYHDIKRRLPYYRSDITDALNYRTFAGTVRIYFVNILPALAFILDMNRRTGGFYGVNEALFSSALACMVFSTLGAQPLTIVGITGLISLFNYTIFDIIKRHDVGLYPQFMSWVAIWAAIFHWMFAVFNFCDYMRYVTDFSSQSFGAYVGIIYCIKGVELLIDEFERSGPTDGFMSVTIALLFFFTVYCLEMVGKGIWFRPWIRDFLGDYAYPIATLFWTGFAHFPGQLRASNVLKLPHTKAFYPTVNRGWLIDFWNLDVKWIFVALPVGFLLMLLFYYDHNQSSVAAQARQFPLRKPGGFHWDFFLLGCTSLIAGLIDIPLPNGLVPQAPVHTDCMTNYARRLKVINTSSSEPDIYSQEIVAESVVEQRVSHFLMGLAIIGTMTGPILVVLHLIPRALFAGVFFVVGWGGLEGNGIMAKMIYLIREPRFVQPDEPLLQIPKRRIMFYLFWQMFGIAATVGVSQTIAGIGFPVLIIALIPLRWKILPKIFTAKELRVMDAPTADNEVVLASMGGKPQLPGGRDDEAAETESVGTRNSAEAQEEKWSATETAVPREGLRERGGGWSEA